MILRSNNGAFSGGRGWDACSGMGSPIAGKLIPLLAPAGVAIKAAAAKKAGKKSAAKKTAAKTTKKAAKKAVKKAAVKKKAAKK